MAFEDKHLVTGGGIKQADATVARRGRDALAIWRPGYAIKRRRSTAENLPQTGKRLAGGHFAILTPVLMAVRVRRNTSMPASMVTSSQPYKLARSSRLFGRGDRALSALQLS